MQEKKVFSLSSLTHSIMNVVNAHCNKVVWIKAEIVKLNYYPKSGHCYPTLVEKKNGKVIAELRGNIWAAQYEAIRKKFSDTLREELRDHMTVVVQGSVTFNPVHGLALNIIDIDPEYTLGELAREKAETILRLKAANVFNANSKTSLPALPKTIAIISVETSKGYGDFMDVINRNSRGYKFHFLLFPAILQGERAVATINQQLERIRPHTTIFDAVAIIRGGGGEIGLSCFDAFVLAEKIATFPIPVLTGIGHANNETVSEMVSYQSFITPTKIAEFLLEKYKEFEFPLQQAEDKLRSESQWLFRNNKNSLKETSRLFSSLTGRFLDSSRSNLTALTYQLENGSMKAIQVQKSLLLQAARSLQLHAGKPIQIEQSKLSFAEEKVKMLSPENILKRGFSITRQNGKVISSTEEADAMLPLETELFSGNLISRIDHINNKINE